MNVIELKTSDPKRFEKEYYKWLEHTPDYEWWDYIEENFTDECAALCVRVDDINFSGFHSQGDGAAFNGRVYVHKWMQLKGFDVTHPAAYLVVKEDDTYVSLETGRGNNMRANLDGPQYYPTPSGIFTGLDMETWANLADDQLSDLSIEDEVLSFCEGLANKLYKDLKAEYEHLTGEEAFIDSCECNEVTFEETGDAIST
jgi:hypothetical protein